MQRVLLIGCAGAGKSTLARRLGDALDLPVFHLDTVYWQPGWVAPEPRDWQARVCALLQGESWILDGNYGGTLDLRLKAADTVIFLDLPRRTCLRRVLVRSLRFHGQIRADSAPGCPDRLSWSFLKWVWSYPAKSRPAILRGLDENKTKKHVVRPRSEAEIEAFARSLAVSNPSAQLRQGKDHGEDDHAPPR